MNRLVILSSIIVFASCASMNGELKHFKASKKEHVNLSAGQDWDFARVHTMIPAIDRP